MWGSLDDWYSRPKLRILADQTIINQIYKPKDWNRITLSTHGNRLKY